jgi:hypothetical protein
MISLARASCARCVATALFLSATAFSASVIAVAAPEEEGLEAFFAAGDDALRRVVERAAPAALTALRVTFLRVGPFEPPPDAAATTREAANAAHEEDAIFKSERRIE